MVVLYENPRLAASGDGRALPFALLAATILHTMGATPDRAPDCLKCRHFRVTWEPAFPRSCELFGIKCRRLPSLEVFSATGAHCPGFELKEGLK